MKYFKEIIKKISKEEAFHYYIKENHFVDECAKHFGITYGMFLKVIKYYGIYKDKKISSDLARKTKNEKYGSPTYNNREQAKNTCLEKYGVDNPFKDVNKIKQSYIDKLGVAHPMYNACIKQQCISNRDYKQSCEKGRKTYKERTGYDNPMKNPEVKKLNLQRRIESGTFDSLGTSNIERRLEKILNRKFDKVINHYRDVRYSRETGYMFECDFYIPSEDLFIELNAHPSHNNRPYYGIETDVTELEKLKSSDKSWNKILVETWSNRDVEKRLCASNSNLNYIVLYPSNSIHNNILFNNKKYSNLITYLLTKLSKK